MPFDVRYCSSNYYHYRILPVINPNYEFLGIQDKNLFDVYFADEELSFPEVLVKNIKGILFDEDMRMISKEQAIERILSVSEFVIKPSIETNSGKNVKKISKANRETVENLFREYKQNFIVQKMVELRQLLAEFNETSVNTFRITTLFLNGKISVCTRILKIGGEGAFVDNFASGGLAIDLDEYGNLGKIAYNKRLEKIEISKEVNFPFYQDLENLAIAKHIKYFPHIGIAGWDLAVDLDGKPVCIEANLSSPHILGFQLSCGPLFGERTQEVIDYVKKHKIENLKVVI